MKKEMIRISYPEIEKGFDLIEFISEISESPKKINILNDLFPVKYEKNKFIIDSVFVGKPEIEKLIISFPETEINFNGIANIAYLFEVDE